jgi:membrane protein
MLNASRRLPGLLRQLASAAREALLRFLRGGIDFVARVYRKAGDDDIFFLAGGIAFNVLVAAVPFLLLLIAIFGFILQATVEDPQQAAVEYVIEILPASPAVVNFTQEVVDEVIDGRGRFGLVGLLLFIWISTRLFGSLRSALRSVFDLKEDRGIVNGKIFDTKMVFVSGLLFVANTGITVLLETVQAFGIGLLGLPDREELQAIQAFYAQMLAFGFIFLMFVLIYRYLPARRIPWRIAIVAASFTALVWELLKSAFAWYVIYIANFATTYGYLATAVILVFWIYYSAVVFILGGEVGQVYELRRVRQRQRELLE